MPVGGHQTVTRASSSEFALRARTDLRSVHVTQTTQTPPERRIMKTHCTVAFAMFAGAAIGATAVNGLHAQAKAPLYLVSEIDVTNPEAYGKEYATKSQALIKAAGGRFAAIGGAAGAGAGKLTAFDGEAPKRVTVQVWDSMEQYQAYRNSPAFKEVRQIGDKYAKFRTFAVEGVSQ
jgi:uncharacterized protein (DUF1330 family)